MANKIVKNGEVRIQSYSWYKKSEVTFSDVIAIVRRQIWEDRYLEQSSQERDSSPFTDDLRDILIEMVCRAS